MPGGAIEQVLENQKQLMRQLADIAIDARLQAEWYTAAECARLKGISQAVLTMNPWMRPLGGKGAKRIARRDRWHRSAVKEWLGQDDQALLELYGKSADKERYLKSGMARAS
jgi:hypothetical protein